MLFKFALYYQLPLDYFQHYATLS